MCELHKKRAVIARTGRKLPRFIGFVFGMAFAFVSAAGVNRAFDIKCGVETLAKVNIESVQNGRQRTSAMIKTDRIDETKLAVTLSLRWTCSTVRPIIFSGWAGRRGANLFHLPSTPKKDRLR